jgi:hypothetical protein
MTSWLIGALAVLGTAAALFGLDRLCLWLEARGLLYYRRTKRQSGIASMCVGLQEFVEPGVKHVREAREHVREEDQEARKQRLMDGLLACLEADVTQVNQVVLYLEAARTAGLDWRSLYEEAVRVYLARHPDRAEGIPRLEDLDELL